MNWHQMTPGDVVAALDSNLEQGLDQVLIDERYSQLGPNAFAEPPAPSLLSKIGHHLKDISTIILLVAAAIASYMAVTTGSGWPKVAVILAIVVINVVLGISQESKAEKALSALKKMHSHQCTALRGGALMSIPATELVPGDIIALAAGDSVPADGRLVSVTNLQVEESSLTGESVPVEKVLNMELADDAALGDRLTMVYSGSLVTAGRGQAVIVETGMRTEMGKIADMLNSTTKQMTPLQKRLKTLAQRIAFIAMASGLLIFLIGVFIHGASLSEMLLTGVTLAVAAVPETLPVIVTLIMANGIQKMVRANTIVRRMTAVETVGNTSVICSDKTGTLTQNKMVVRKLWEVGGQAGDATEEFTADEQHMLDLLAACTNAVPSPDNHSHTGAPARSGAALDETGEPIDSTHQSEAAPPAALVDIIGDPTEAAIVRLLLDKGFTKTEVETRYPRVFEIPFDSTRKLMTTVHRNGSGYLSITKGAFDRIPVRTDSAAGADQLARAERIHDEFASGALRVIAVAVKTWDTLPADLNPDSLEKDLDLIGLIGLIDPPRPESYRAVARAKRAGIKTVMITGDHVATAAAIAEDIGILEPGDKAVTGVELGAMSEAELAGRVQDISVYARVSPEDKIRIVRAWQSRGEVITMTGDGVNDAPALKQADVGAAMGITGTDVSKSAADVILTDDNFATIVEAVHEGRTAYDNIRKVVNFLLSVNFAEILVMLIGVVVGWGTPINSIQLLFINVVADGIPGFSLSREAPEADLMDRKPLSKRASLFAAGLGNRIATNATAFIILTLTAFAIGRFVPFDGYAGTYARGTTMAFLVLAWASALNIMNIRSRRSIFRDPPGANHWLIGTVVVSLLLSAAVALIPPIQAAFGMAPIGLAHWGIAAGLALLILVYGEVSKLILNHRTAQQASRALVARTVKTAIAA